jgi:hypothetical protein
MSEGSHSYPPLFHHLLGSSSPCHNHGSWPNQAFLFSRAKYRGGKIGTRELLSDVSLAREQTWPWQAEAGGGFDAYCPGPEGQHLFAYMCRFYFV